MSIPLADTIDILLPHLTPGLTTSGDVSRLQELARALPPIHQGSLECRLSARASQVDLEQAILGYAGEPEALLEHVDRMTAAGEVHPAWNRLRDFCTRWIAPASLLHDSIPAIWLELDAGVLAPSFFVTLRAEGLPTVQAGAVAEEVLGVLLDAPVSPLLQANARRCFEAGADIAYVHWFGVMLARPVETLRFVVHPLTAEHIVPYLERVGWPGDVHEMASLAEQLLGLVDRIDMIDLDVGAQVQSQIGLECVFDKPPLREPRWAAFLDHLVACGLCAPAKRAALLAWPGYTDPAPGPLA